MAKNVYRYDKRTYGEKGELLPKRLSFLSELPFCTVIEDRRGLRMQTRVEVLPATLKRLLASVSHHSEMAKPNRDVVERKNREIEHLQKLLGELHSSKEKLAAELSVALLSAENANEKLGQFNDRATPDATTGKASGPLAGYLGRAEARGFKPHGLPLQGGLPSLPKRR